MRGCIFRRALSFLFFIIFFSPYVWAEDAFDGVQTEDIPVIARDGAITSLKHLIAQKDKAPPSQVVLFGPGILETPEQLASLVQPFYNADYEVFIEKVRLAGRLGEPMTGRSAVNGLDEMLLLDYPAQLRELMRRSDGRPVHLIGHSLGGMQILAVLSDPNLREEFKDFLPQIKAITLFMTPYDLNDLNSVVKRITQVLLLPLEFMEILGKQSLGIHHKPFKVTRFLQDHPNVILQWAGQKLEAILAEAGTLFLNGLIMSRDFMSSKMRQEFFQRTSRLPITALKDLGQAALTGQFMKRDSSLRGNDRFFFHPERIEAIPIQLVVSSHDIFVSMESSKRLQRALPSNPLNRVVVLNKGTHVGPLVGDRVPFDFYEEVKAFHDCPFQSIRQKGHEVHLEVNSKYCRVLLRKHKS